MVSQNEYHPGKKSVKDKTTNRMDNKTSAGDEIKSHLDRIQKHRGVARMHLKQRQACI